MDETTFSQQRHWLVDRELRNRGIRDERVLDAMKSVPREKFVTEDLQDRAYENRPLPIASEQTISQPLIVAIMTEALELTPAARVLEIGTGSGYAAAVLAEIAQEVFTIERHPGLAESSARLLSELGYRNVHVKQGDGTLGWPEESPFDGIVVTAAGPKIPATLKAQLKIGGRLVIPVGESGDQNLVRTTRHGPEEYETEDLGPVRFVPLIGEEGW
jgi:protein-L-isoaspartate(D-aspartate) O-methyltransferase